MRVFTCEHCDAVVSFVASQCASCGRALGYVPEDLALRVLLVGANDHEYIDHLGRRRWRCLNAAWGCNWTIPATSGDVWCRSCRLTRHRPDLGHPEAVEAWRIAEAAKRRLVHQLDQLGLPFEPRSDAAPRGLVFDLVHVPGATSVTGHLDGVITLDLVETDDRHREELRAMFDEPIRTVLGHLRHEIGHYLFRTAVEEAGAIEEFRSIFGDERSDYREALERHGADATARDRRRYVTDYSAAHPLEDWAETVAHHLHIVDVVDSAAAHGLLPGGWQAGTAEAVWGRDLVELLRRWRPVNDGLGAMSAALGLAPPHPIDPVGLVVDKLTVVHRLLRSLAATNGARATTATTEADEAVACTADDTPLPHDDLPHDDLPHDDLPHDEGTTTDADR